MLNELITMNQEWMVKTKSLSIFEGLLSPDDIKLTEDMSALCLSIIKGSAGENSFWFKADNDFHLMVTFSHFYCPLWTVTHYKPRNKYTMFRETIAYYRKVKNASMATILAISRQKHIDGCVIYFNDARQISLYQTQSNNAKLISRLPIPDVLMAKRKKPTLKSV